MKSVKDPFKLQKLEEIELAEAPLKSVIAQIRFPPVLLVEDRKYIAKFHDSLRSDYPEVKDHKTYSVNILDPKDKTEGVFWSFFDEDNDWRIILAPEFLAIETHVYKSRTDFFNRFKKALTSLNSFIAPSACNRIGVRYVNQIVNPEFERVSELFKDEILGIYTSDLRSKISSSLRQTVFSVTQEVKLSARWGVLSQGQTYDPSALDPIEDTSWILDLDVFNMKKQKFDSKSILKQSKELSEYAYNFFRWAITKEFISTYKGEKVE